MEFGRVGCEVVHISVFNPGAASAKVIGKVVVYVLSESAHVSVGVSICIAERLETFHGGLVKQ